MLYEIILRAAETHPEKVAVVCGGKKWSYAQFKERVDRLASGLLSLGVKEGTKVAILHRNCHRYLELYFASAKIGAVVVPLNYRLSLHDFLYILEDSFSKVLLAQPDLLASFGGERNKISRLVQIILTESPQLSHLAFEHLKYESLLEESDPEESRYTKIPDSSIAQIYYTSGTTGRAKGVILTHKNNYFHARGAIAELGINQDDVWLHVSPLFHLADAWAVWALSEVCARHILIPAFEPELVLSSIQQNRVTLSNFIPTMLNILINYPRVSKYDFSSLRLILSGGAPIAKEVIRKVVEIFGCEYIQTYGLTETSPFLTMSILSPEMKRLPFEERLKYMATTGRPCGFVELKVVKEDGREVVKNEEDVGEIIVRGESVTCGYWRMPEETSRRILDGWFHTRDLAVVNPEGYVTIVDRKDDLIISGGEKVYSIEVENVLYSHPKIFEAAVIGLPDPVWGECVTAIVVLKENEFTPEEEIIKFCKERMAHFKAPKKVIFAKNLPKTGSAKVFKYKLREEYGKKNLPQIF